MEWSNLCRYSCDEFDFSFKSRIFISVVRKSFMISKARGLGDCNVHEITFSRIWWSTLCELRISWGETDGIWWKGIHLSRWVLSSFFGHELIAGAYNGNCSATAVLESRGWWLRQSMDARRDLAYDQGQRPRGRWSFSCFAYSIVEALSGRLGYSSGDDVQGMVSWSFGA